MRRLLIFFEDDSIDNFYPLSLSHTTYDLRCGMFSLGEKWRRRFSECEVRLITRPYLQSHLEKRLKFKVNDLDPSDSDQAVLINPCFLPNVNVVKQITSVDQAEAFYLDKQLVALTCPSARLKELTSTYDSIVQFADSLPKSNLELKSVKYLWDLVAINGEEICSDFELLRDALPFKKMFAQCTVDDAALIYDLENVYLGEGCQIDGQVVLDARRGPIYIDRDVTIVPHTRVEGPCYVGPKTQLVGGKIRSGCSFGPECRVGGEVEESIFHGYTNKYHEGFIGHAYLGEWVNLGALTTNSDLKNNYGPIKVDLPTGQVNSHLTKVGSFIGDHTKTGIGTLLNTGMVIGFSVNLYGGGLVSQRHLPSFVWGGRDGFVDYRVEKAVETGKVVISRRDRQWSESDQRLFENLFELTSDQRRLLKGQRAAE